MNPPNGPSNNSESTPFKVNGAEFEQALQEVESLLQNIKERYCQIQTAKQHRAELQQHLRQLQTELHQTKEKLEAIEINLESRLLSWSSQREIFWQIVRFVGLGIVIGLVLKSCTG